MWFFVYYRGKYSASYADVSERSDPKDAYDLRHYESVNLKETDYVPFKFYRK
jgi:hypothetical protein